MSDIPREVHDALVQRLQEAVGHRDRQLGEMQGDANRLRSTLSTLESQMRQQESMVRQLGVEMAETDRRIDREVATARSNLTNLRQRMESQHAQLCQEITAAEKRHLQDWSRLRQEIEDVATARTAKESQIRQLAAVAVTHASKQLTSIDTGEVEALDLGGNLAAATSQLHAAVAVVADPSALATEQLSAALGADDAISRLGHLLRHRRTVLEEEARQLEQAADFLDELLAGKPSGDLPDQSETIEDLLKVEAQSCRSMISSFLRKPAAAIRRWNGHAATIAKLEGVRDLLAREIALARRYLDQAAAYDEERYLLTHVEDELRIRFGHLDLEGESFGAWVDPDNHKSTYLHFLPTTAGEIQIAVPWLGPLRVTHEGREAVVLEAFRDGTGEPGLVWIGNLSKRWQQLAANLQNPHWDPDL